MYRSGVLRDPAVQSKWMLRCQYPDIALRLSAILKIDPVVAQVLLNRGCRSVFDAQRFLTPTNTDPSIPDMWESATQIVSACIQNNNTILIIGDYDVDGITATVMAMTILTDQGARVHYWIPNRFTDGYGLNLNVIPIIQNQGVDLVLTLDCGISNFNEITAIKAETGAKIVVFDHHTIPDKLPPADAIVNPKFLAESDPLYGMCTAGIVYKWIEYWVKTRNLSFDMSELVDLAAMGTIADVAPLVGENRRMVQIGLIEIARRNRIGLRELLQVAKFTSEWVTPRDVGFVIAPRFNAAGRLADAKLAVELLLSADATQAAKMARSLDAINLDRRQQGHAQLEEAISQIESQGGIGFPVIVLSSRDWHPGIIGITAARLAEKYHRPTILISVDGEIGRGSARTYGSVNIDSIIRDNSRLLINFGGHKQAAGFTIRVGDIAQFIAEIQADAVDKITDQSLRQPIEIDACIESPIGDELVSQIQKLAPFGAGNPAPIFYSTSWTPVQFKLVGNGDHLKATFQHKDGQIVDGIGFNLADRLERLYQSSVHLAFSIEYNYWRNQKIVQFQLVDIQ